MLRAFRMEVAISAVAGELVSRLISFLTNQYQSSNHAQSEEEKVERLQHLLMRISTVVEEADGRYITNSGMLMQLKMLSAAMYRGYRVLHTSRYQALEDTNLNQVSDSPSSLHLGIPLKRSRTVAINRKDKILYLELHGALESLEMAVANMKEFVVLLGGCDRMLRRPYDTYLYMDNFMFGRHAEKQKVLSFLLEHKHLGAPAVLPIIGGVAVGKKTLVAHVCDDVRVRSHFTSILHLHGDTFLRIRNRERTVSGMILVVVEFLADVDDEDWAEFYSSVASMDRGSKVIILSRLKKLEKFGTVRPIFLSGLSYDEFSYLFKALALGAANPVEHTQLVQIGEEFVKELQLGWSLVPANAFANVLRKNLNAQVWLCLLNRYKRVIQKNISMYGMHPNILFEQGHPVDISDFALHPLSRPLRIKLTTGRSSTVNISKIKELKKVTFVGLLVEPVVTPKGEFYLVSWESRIPPYTSIVHSVPSCDQDMSETPLLGRKRRGVPI